MQGRGGSLRGTSFQSCDPAMIYVALLQTLYMRFNQFHPKSATLYKFFGSMNENQLHQPSAFVNKQQITTLE